METWSKHPEDGHLEMSALSGTFLVFFFFNKITSCARVVSAAGSQHGSIQPGVSMVCLWVSGFPPTARKHAITIGDSKSTRSVVCKLEMALADPDSRDRV